MMNNLDKVTEEIVICNGCNGKGYWCMSERPDPGYSPLYPCGKCHGNRVLMRTTYSKVEYKSLEKWTTPPDVPPIAS